MDVNEARKGLEQCLGEDLRREYFAALRQWFLFGSSTTKEDFDKAVRILLTTAEQIRFHNYFLLAILAKSRSNRVKHVRSSNNEKGAFECAEYSDYVQPSSPTMIPPADFENRSAAAELFIPDSGFVACRIAVVAWNNRMEGADDDVTEIVVHACQVFVKNILTAMVSRKKGYKIRDGKFQYGFNQPVPDPFIRNFSNVIDETQESKVEVCNNDDSFVQKCKTSLENAEQQVAFAYSCAKRKSMDNVLTVKLLYDTLRENPRILGLNALQSVNVMKLGLQLED